MRDLSLMQKIRLSFLRLINNDRKRKHSLFQLFWECTLKCNLNCLHCGSDCKMSPNVGEMPLSDFLHVLDEIRQSMDASKILVVTIGGEPLVRRDIIECGKEITRRGFLWGMVSNGMLLTDKKIDELIAAGLRTISISLDGFESEHNWMRGHPNSFKMAESAIRALSFRKIVWDVITCVNQRNLTKLEEFKEYLIRENVKNWRVFTVFPAGRAKDNIELQLTNEQYRGLMEFIISVRREGRINLSYGCEGFLGKYEMKVRDYLFFCQAGINVASILNDGSISGCLSIRSNYHQGNIYQDHFIDVWEHRFQSYRDRSWMKTEKCTSCKMWSYCEGNGMHLRDENKKLLFCNYDKLME